ncbi:MAG: c-type cytochrome [Methyloligellaceae bacterium]
MRTRYSFCLSFSFGFYLLLSIPVTADDIKRGQLISEQHCSRCHVVGDFNPTGGISSTPSFQLLVKRRPDYKERFETFYARRPHPAFLLMEGIERPLKHVPPNAYPVPLTVDEVNCIVAFIETLKQE